MTAEDIRKGIIRLLRERTDVENITGEDLETAKDYAALRKDGEENVLPTFQVLIEPIYTGNAAAGFHRDRKVFVDIAYMEQRYTSNRSVQRRLNELSDILLPYFNVQDRAFSPALDFNITDGVGHCTFTLEWTDMVPVETAEPVAGEIHIRI